jgi:hypothetical protein
VKAFRDPETKAKLEEALEYYYANVHYVPSPDVNPVSFYTHCFRRIVGASSFVGRHLSWSIG